MIKKIAQLTLSLLLLAGFMLPAKASAATVAMKLNPSTTNVVSGDTFTVTVRLELGSNTSFDALATLNYDSSKVQYVSADYSPSSAFGSSGPDAGPINSSSYRVDGWFETIEATGNVDIVRITFKALASSGTAVYSLSDISVSDASVPPPAPDHIVNPSGTSVTLTAPATPTPTPTNNSTTNSNQQTNNTASPTQQTAGIPTIEELEANAVYDDDQPVEVQAVNLGDQALYDILVSVTDTSGNPQQGIELQLGDKTSTTDDKGQAEFLGVAAGVYTLKGDGVDRLLTVAVGDPDIQQEFAVVVEESNAIIAFIKDNSLIIGGTILLFAAATIGFFVVKNQLAMSRFNKLANKSSMPAGPNDKKTPEKPSITEEDKRMDEFLKPEPPAADTVVHPDNKDK